MDYTFTITAIRTYDTDDMQDVIKEADWILYSYQDGFGYNVATTSKFTDPKPEQFIPFNQVAEAQLKSWIEETQEYKNAYVHVTEVVQKQVDKQQLTTKPLPWNPTEPTIPPV